MPTTRIKLGALELWFAVLSLSLVAVAASAQRGRERSAAVPAPALIEAGRLPWGRTASGAITVINPRRDDKRKECKEAHDFRVLLDEAAARFLRLPEDPTLYDVPLGGQKQIAVAVDTKGLPRPRAGGSDAHEGTVTATCLTCGACALERQQVRIRLVVTDPGESPPDRGGDTHAPEGGGPQSSGTNPEVADPRDAIRPAAVCGPDVTEAFIAMLDRLEDRFKRLPGTERGWERTKLTAISKADRRRVKRDPNAPNPGAAFKARNPDRPLAVAAVASCPRPPERCGGTVTLSGSCVTESMLRLLVEGFIDEGLGVANPFGGSDRRTKRIANEDDSVEEKRNRWAYGKGRVLYHYAGLETLDDWQGFAVTDACAPCGEPTSFNSDWSLQEWKLEHGRIQPP